MKWMKKVIGYIVILIIPLFKMLLLHFVISHLFHSRLLLLLFLILLHQSMEMHLSIISSLINLPLHQKWDSDRRDLLLKRDSGNWPWSEESFMLLIKIESRIVRPFVHFCWRNSNSNWWWRWIIYRSKVRLSPSLLSIHSPHYSIESRRDNLLETGITCKNEEYCAEQCEEDRWEGRDGREGRGREGKTGGEKLLTSISSKLSEFPSVEWLNLFFDWLLNRAFHSLFFLEREQGKGREWKWEESLRNPFKPDWILSVPISFCLLGIEGWHNTTMITMIGKSEWELDGSINNYSTPVCRNGECICNKCAKHICDFEKRGKYSIGSLME